MFFPALQLAPTCAAVALFAGPYTADGGLRAVVYTDVVQALVLLGGSLLLRCCTTARGPTNGQSSARTSAAARSPERTAPSK